MLFYTRICWTIHERVQYFHGEGSIEQPVEPSKMKVLLRTSILVGLTMTLFKKCVFVSPVYIQM